MSRSLHARHRYNLGAEDQCPVCKVWFNEGDFHVCTPRPNRVIQHTPVTEQDQVRAAVAALFARVTAAAELHELLLPTSAPQAALVLPHIHCPNNPIPAQPDYLYDASFLEAAFLPILPILPILVTPLPTPPPAPVTVEQAEDPKEQHVPRFPPRMDGHPDFQYRKQVEAVMQARKLSIADMEFIHLAVNVLGLSG